jgi:hypothetical protein
MNTHLFIRRWFGVWGMARSFIIGMTMGLVTDPVANCSVMLSIIALDFLLNAVGHPHVDNITYFKQFIMIRSRVCTVTVTFLFFRGIISDVQMEAFFTFFSLAGFFPSLIETIFTTVRNVMSLYSAVMVDAVNAEELKEQKESFLGTLCLSVVTIFKDTLPAKLQALLPKKVLPAWCCQCVKRWWAAREAQVTSASEGILLDDKQHTARLSQTIPEQKKIPGGSNNNTQARNFQSVSSSLMLLCSGNLAASSSRDTSQSHEPPSPSKLLSPAHRAGKLPTTSPPEMKPPGSIPANPYGMQLSTVPLQIQPIRHTLPTFLLSPSRQHGSPPPTPQYVLPLPEQQQVMASSPVHVASPGSPQQVMAASPVRVASPGSPQQVMASSAMHVASPGSPQQVLVSSFVRVASPGSPIMVLTGSPPQ